MIYIIIVLGALLLGAIFMLGRTSGSHEIDDIPVNQLDPAWNPEKEKETRNEIESLSNDKLVDDLNDMLSKRRGYSD